MIHSLLLRVAAVCSIVACVALPSFSRTWNVGTNRTYTKPSQVMSLVSTGDTVLIDSGLYVKDVGVWRANRLVLKCPVGYAHLDAQGTAANRKGIWVIDGDSAYVEGIEFSGCAISEADGSNGAGIRFESHILECRRCYFHDNQEGILTGNDTTNEIRIEACEFDHNGVETGGAAGFQHNIYVGHSRLCRIAFCYFQRSIVGHEIKSRANRSYIFSNYIVDGPDGDGSYSIDLPNGGLGDVVGNVIQKGPNAQNSTVITYGEEGLINPEQRFVFTHNTVVTDRHPTTFMRVAAGTESALIANNIFAGSTQFLVGSADTQNNVVSADTGLFHFRDSRSYDYHITAPFAGLLQVAALSEANDGVLLWPRREYSHPLDSSAERTSPPQFIGALAPVYQEDVQDENDVTQSQCFPNPFESATYIQLSSPSSAAELHTTLFDAIGHERTANAHLVSPDLLQVDRSGLSSGVYHYAVSTGSRLVASGSVVIR